MKHKSAYKEFYKALQALPLPRIYTLSIQDQ